MFLETNCNNLKAISVLLGFHPVLMTDILYNNSNSAKYGKLRKHITIQEILLEKVTAWVLKRDVDEGVYVCFLCLSCDILRIW